MDEGKEIVIATHSYGGIPGCASTAGLSIEERAVQGMKGGFRAIIFMAAFTISKAGMTCAETFGQESAVWLDFRVCNSPSIFELDSII